MSFSLSFFSFFDDEVCLPFFFYRSTLLLLLLKFLLESGFLLVELCCELIFHLGLFLDLSLSKLVNETVPDQTVGFGSELLHLAVVDALLDGDHNEDGDIKEHSQTDNRGKGVATNLICFRVPVVFGEENDQVG